MPLIKGGRVVDDPWVVVDDDTPTPDEAAVIVGLGRWQNERDVLLARKAAIGVRLKSDQMAETLADDVAHLHLIALEFPVFRDGRAYSTARLLRERYGFRGELRAVGNVLPDQFFFMLRCGFDAFEVANERYASGWDRAVTAFSGVYQVATDDRMPIPQLRGRPRAAE